MLFEREKASKNEDKNAMKKAKKKKQEVTIARASGEKKAGKKKTEKKIK